MIDKDLRLMLICSFRYALETRHVAEHVAALIERHWHLIARHDQQLFHREISDAIQKHNIGDQFDRKTFEKILNLSLTSSNQT